MDNNQFSKEMPGNQASFSVLILSTHPNYNLPGKNMAAQPGVEQIIQKMNSNDCMKKAKNKGK